MPAKMQAGATHAIVQCKYVMCQNYLIVFKRTNLLSLETETSMKSKMTRV